MRYIISRCVLFLFLLFLQLLLVNNFYLFGFINPFIYLVFLVDFPIIKRHYFLLVGFFTGFILDIFSNTFGLHAIACLTMSYFRCFYISFLEKKELTKGSLSTPSISSLKFLGYLKYLFLMIFIHHWTLYFFQELSLFSFFSYTLKALLHTIFSTLMILLIHFFISKRTT